MGLPRSIGIPSVAKNPGPTGRPKTTRTSPGGVAYPSKEKLLLEELPLIGLNRAMLAELTPGRLFSLS
jgi:hypothetical protein